MQDLRDQRRGGMEEFEMVLLREEVCGARVDAWGRGQDLRFGPQDVVVVR